MNPIYISFCLALALCCSGALAFEGARGEQRAVARENVAEEMNLINKSLEDLLGELAIIRREANGRLLNVKNRASGSTQDDQAERIRQTKVSKFVLKRVAELEAESLGMRDELAKLFQLQKPSMYMAGELKQEDQDFEEPQPTSTTSKLETPATSSEGMPATTAKPTLEEEAAKIGFDLEALKRLGEEIGKRLDQIGKDAAKNLGELLEGVKLVFRQPNGTSTTPPTVSSRADLENEIEARQNQPAESLRGVHESVIKLVDNMVQNYLANVRRAVQRMTNFIDNRRGLQNQQPRGSAAAPTDLLDEEAAQRVPATSQTVLDEIQQLSKSVHDFNNQWARIIGKQSSPLIDRIPPRGIELWTDFWHTVRKQIRRINQEFRQVTTDMTRMITGRLPSGSSEPGQRERTGSLLYSADHTDQAVAQFQSFYARMSAILGTEQQKMDSLSKLSHSASGDQAAVNKISDASSLIDEDDDEQTRNELTRNVALRQQISQEINVFGSIFDIMEAFVQRLRESASSFRDVLRPGGSNNNDNNPVTPGPSVKPQVDKLLDETLDSQRNINGQAKPVLLPNSRPALNPRRAQ